MRHLARRAGHRGEAVKEEMKGRNHLSPLRQAMELQNLVLACLYFGLDFKQYLLTMSPFPPFAMVMYILSHYMLEVCDLPFDFQAV